MPRIKYTKERILESALRLFSERGIRETTIKDIAKEVGITEGAIYRHFVSKDQIVSTLFSTYSKNLYEELMSVVEEKTSMERKFFKLVKTFLDFCFKNPQAFKFINLFHYLRADEVKNFKNLPKDALTQFMDEGFRKGVIKVRKELALAMVIGTLERIFLFVEGGIMERGEGLEEELAQALWKAITSR